MVKEKRNYDEFVKMMMTTDTGNDAAAGSAAGGGNSSDQPVTVTEPTDLPQ